MAEVHEYLGWLALSVVLTAAAYAWLVSAGQPGDRLSALRVALAALVQGFTLAVVGAVLLDLPVPLADELRRWILALAVVIVFAAAGLAVGDRAWVTATWALPAAGLIVIAELMTEPPAQLVLYLGAVMLVAAIAMSRRVAVWWGWHIVEPIERAIAITRSSRS